MNKSYIKIIQKKRTFFVPFFAQKSIEIVKKMLNINDILRIIPFFRIKIKNGNNSKYVLYKKIKRGNNILPIDNVDFTINFRLNRLVLLFFNYLIFLNLLFFIHIPFKFV